MKLKKNILMIICLIKFDIRYLICSNTKKEERHKNQKSRFKVYQENYS